ncbi:hypothetical protein R3W88_019080 [Solanum pinnatisectum]|uniref:Protein kinase domain-containing protein n=1 Tax=Solanum pinnatisectum TaxID=50273 RepID=A0AAV9KJT4_9SOLN|nr:hypothetical protein R3W88_019080 [Solanum pinnatisectum]
MDSRYSTIFSFVRDESVEITEASDGVETFTAEEIFHTRRWKPNPSLIRGVSKGIEVELVAAGWLYWLVAAADSVLNKVVALKKVRFDNHDPESVKFMAREIVILRRLGDHPNVIKLEGLVTSRMPCSLYLNTKVSSFLNLEIKCYMRQLLEGLDHCHSHGILHRDIKTSNLLVNKEDILKIADFGLSTFFEPEQCIPLTNKVVTLWYRPPELLLGSNCYGVGVDLWGVACVLGELFTGKPIMPGRTEVEQLHKVFKLCGSPSDDFWQKSKFPTAQIFKPIEPYRRNFEATFHDVPAAAVRLMDTLLSIEAEYRGTAALALKSEFFTTEPFACDASSLPQCPPCRKINAQFYAKKTEIRGRRDRKYVRNRIREIQVAEANAQLDSNMFRRKLLTQSKGQNRHDEKNEYVSGGVLKEGTNSTAFFQLSSRKEEPIHDDHDSKGKKKWSGPLPAPSDKMQDLIREHAVMILGAATQNKAQILQDAQCVMSEKEKMVEGEGNNSKVVKNQLIEQLLPPAESDGHDFLEDNQYFGPLPSALKPMDVDRILRAHDQQIQESVERAKQRNKTS